METIKLRTPDGDKGYGIEIMSLKKPFILPVLQSIMARKRDWNPFFQGGSRDDDKEWIFYEFWTFNPKKDSDELLNIVSELAEKFDLKVI